MSNKKDLLSNGQLQSSYTWMNVDLRILNWKVPKYVPNIENI